VKVILRPRGTGRTDELIRLCAEAEKAGETSYIVCNSQEEARRIKLRAEELKLFIAFPITTYEFLARKYSAANIKNFYFDNVDHFLQTMTNVPIRAVTLEQSKDE
jgi:hypothetical protein